MIGPDLCGWCTPVEEAMVLVDNELWTNSGADRRDIMMYNVPAEYGLGQENW